MEATAETHIRDIYSEQELQQMDSIEEAASWLDYQGLPVTSPTRSSSTTLLRRAFNEILDVSRV